MKTDADQLLEDLEYIRTNAGTVGPDHPKVKKWVGEVRSYLSREGNTKSLKRFEQLEFVKGGSEMWSEYSITQGNIRKYKADLDKVETILEPMASGSGAASADQELREMFLTSTEESVEVESEEAVQVERGKIPRAESTNRGTKETAEEPLSLEKAMDQKIEPNFEAVTKQHLSASAREEAVDQLMADLSAEMKSLDPDWEKVQRVMANLMGLKKTGELLDRLKAEVNNPEVKWEAVRKLMAQLWSIKKEIIIDLLPTLLKV